MPARSWRVVGAALACGAAAAAASMTVAMTPARAEAQATTARLTLTGMVDANCPVDVGGTAVYVAPGGTVTLQASLAGASLRLGVLTIPLDAGHIASFVDTVTIDGAPTTLRGGDSLVLRNITDATAVEWRATAVSLLPAFAGGITVALNANNVSLPAGAELDWTGQIVPSANTRCGVAVALPTVRASVGTHTVTVPGVGVTVSLPARSPTTSAAPPSRSAAPTTSPSQPPAGSPSTERPVTHTSSSHPAIGSAVPSRSAIDRGPQTHPTRHRMPAERSARDATTRATHPGQAGPAPGSAPPRVRSTVPLGDVRQTPAADEQSGKDVTAPGTQRLSGGSLPALLAIAALLALSLVTAVYVRQYLAGGRRR